MTRRRPFAGDQGTLRKGNLTAILNYLRQYAPISRAALADMTGLNKATVTRLIRDLIDHGFVRESGFQASNGGRPSILLELDPQGGYIIGARLDVDYSSVLLTDFAAETVWRADVRHSRDDGQEAIQAELLSLIQQACDHVPETGRPILGLGVSMPGLVDVASGTLLFAPNLGWHDVPIKAWLSQAFHFPIYVDNEANLSALGECYFGAAQDVDHVLLVSITAGVGAGIVVNQQILSGVSGLAGEVGHMTIDPHGPRCNCGKLGCWEAFVSAPALFNRIREMIAAGQSSELTEDVLANFNRSAIPTVVEAAQKGDEATRNALAETANLIGLGLADLVNVFNPERVVLGGYLSPLYPLMLPQIESVVEERALRWTCEACDIAIAEYGSDASLMGTIATIYDHVLSFPVETLERSVKSATTQKGGGY
ncbi:MAG: ROK family protein [Anaerolineae bacterium]